MVNDPTPLLAFLGLLAAETPRGRRAVAWSLVDGSGAPLSSGAFASGIDANDDIAAEWLLSHGIGPNTPRLEVDDAVTAAMLPSLRARTAVVHSSDVDLAPIHTLREHAAEELGIVNVSAVDLTSPDDAAHVADARANALRLAYQAALSAAQTLPKRHTVDAMLSPNGDLARVWVTGPFTHAEWTGEHIALGLWTLQDLEPQGVVHVRAGYAAEPLSAALTAAGVVHVMPVVPALR